MGLHSLQVIQEEHATIGMTMVGAQLVNHKSSLELFFVFQLSYHNEL